MGSLRKPARGGMVPGFSGQRIDRFLGTKKVDKKIKSDLKAGRIKLTTEGKIKVTAKGTRFFKMKSGGSLKRRGS